MFHLLRLREAAKWEKDGLARLLSRLGVKERILTALPDDDHGQDTRGDTKVHWNHHQASMQWFRPFEHTVLGDEEDDHGEASGNTRGDEPRSKHLADTLPTPVDAVSAEGSNTDTDNTADDRVTSESLAL